MTIQRIKQDIAELKEAINVKNETPWDCKLLMMQYRDEWNRRSITKKLYELSGESWIEPGPIELSCGVYFNLSREASAFLALSDEEKMEAIEKEFPPKHVYQEEAEECRRRIMAKLNIMGERMSLDASTY